MKKVFILLILFFSILSAKEQLVDGIAVLINGEAVTIYDLKKTTQSRRPCTCFN